MQIEKRWRERERERERERGGPPLSSVIYCAGASCIRLAYAKKKCTFSSAQQPWEKKAKVDQATYVRTDYANYKQKDERNAAS
jgi:hypothetical protein